MHITNIQYAKESKIHPSDNWDTANKTNMTWRNNQKKKLAFTVINIYEIQNKLIRSQMDKLELHAQK